MNKKRRGELISGLTLIAVGAIVLLARQDFLTRDVLSDFWPLALIFFGLSDLVAGDILKGQWVAALGGAFQLHTLDYVALADSWPVLAILAGLGVVYGSFVHPRERTESPRALEGL